MMLIGYGVTHKIFGHGVIIAQEGHYLVVRFSVGEKQFVYPDVFDGFMEIEDASADVQIQEDILTKKAEREEVAAKRRSEKEHEMQDGVVISGGFTTIDLDGMPAAGED